MDYSDSWKDGRPELSVWTDDFTLQRELPGLVENLDEMNTEKRFWYLSLINSVHRKREADRNAKRGKR